MLKSLYFKIVLILLIFIIAVMAAVGAILMNGVASFYMDDFTDQMKECFDPDGFIMRDLLAASDEPNYAYEMKNILSNYRSVLGIDEYRNYYVLNLDGEMLHGSDTDLGASLAVTPNLLSAVSGTETNIRTGGMDYADWAVRIPVEDGEDCIVYVKDSLDEMRRLNSMLFSIVLQALLIGVLIAVLLSFFLAKSISSPLQSLTSDTQRVASGEFSHEIEVNSEDEIGVLAENFNYMKERLRSTLDEVDGERKKLDTVLSCMRDGVLAFLADGTVLHSNNSAEELFGDALRRNAVTLEACFEKLDLPLIETKDGVKLTSEDAEVTRDGYIFRDRSVDGRVYDVSFAKLTPISDGEVTLDGYLFIIHDVTSRYELDESRREFVANVSHELRTPLTSIKGATETVRMDEGMDEATRDYFLDMVLSESDRMTRIVSDLLVLSRLDNKRTKWNIETFDLKQSVRHLCEVMRPDIEAHRHRVTFGSPKEVPPITADRQRIEQVIINILSNAVKYTPDGGRIDIELKHSRAKKSLLLTIRDNGVGIPKEDLEHLFERFYRVEKSRTQDAGGTGLGLAIAKELVEAHGGTISIDSVLSEGTTVRIELPIECKLKTE
ncbi:MAG: cell wall metabolism sensor histidine kinase WalK [Clostridiales bacterium]|nr:cell wall metabolism sensor histidine kinase WalK [Clostridiales bacterium]